MLFCNRETEKAKVIHFDDKKRRWQSHEVYLDSEKGYLSFDVFGIVGYGASKEEAFEEFKRDMKRFTESINNLNNRIQEMTIEELEEH